MPQTPSGTTDFKRRVAEGKRRLVLFVPPHGGSPVRDLPPVNTEFELSQSTKDEGQVLVIRYLAIGLNP